MITPTLIFFAYETKVYTIRLGWSLEEISRVNSNVSGILIQILKIEENNIQEAVMTVIIII